MPRTTRATLRRPLRLTLFAARRNTGSPRREGIDFHAPYLCARSRRAGEDDVQCGERGRGTAARRSPRMRTGERGRRSRRRTCGARRSASPSGSASHTGSRIPRTRPRFAPPSNALNTRAALTLYLLIVSVITARTVALTLIKVQLNKTKTENNHFCLTGKMARYVAEAVTAHAPLAKHMFFRPELCAGLMHRAGGAAPRDERPKLRIMRRELARTANKAEHRR